MKKVCSSKYLKRLKFMCVIGGKIKSKSVSHKTEITKQPSDLLAHLTSCPTPEKKPSDLQNKTFSSTWHDCQPNREPINFQFHVNLHINILCIVIVAMISRLQMCWSSCC